METRLTRYRVRAGKESVLKELIQECIEFDPEPVILDEMCSCTKKSKTTF